VEIVCAGALAVLAGMILYSIALYEWFLVTYRQYYQQFDSTERAEVLAYEACEILLALWMLVLSVNVARAGARRDRGLFGPIALRIWGTIFAALPVVAIVSSRSLQLDYHVVAFFWTAAIACFTLASRRSQRSVETGPAPQRSGSLPPRSIE
jgi:hypothetical protein